MRIRPKRYENEFLCRSVIHFTPTGFRFISFWFATNMSLLTEFQFVHFFMLRVRDSVLRFFPPVTEALLQEITSNVLESSFTSRMEQKKVNEPELR